MYTISEVVEMGKAQDVILQTKDVLTFDDAQPNSQEMGESFDE